ncbi:MAG TPA: inositol 2-dehydrogenase [Steroidobacteraceae bacterium]|jgi:myo-inositol 2-dehydrogenase/D-chiro-inositol 1-dehydrogenase|nr:inositol 2-dehydrogenase [Steroidobacteraceae bacterium]
MLGMAVLGCGRIGRLHAANVARHTGARLLKVYDLAAAAAAATAAELGALAAASLDEVWSDRAIAAVLIATPTATHVPLITQAVAAGKAVLCEKPVDLDLGRARQCWQEIAPRTPRVMIGFNRRFDPSYYSLRERLQRGEVGRLEIAVITNRDPAPPPADYIAGSGGLFRDMTIHDFDMARYLAGDIARVHAFGANLVDAEIGRQGDIDTCAISLEARSGALVQINNSRRSVYGYDQRIEAFGATGMLQAGNRRATSVESWSAARTAARDPVLYSFIERYNEAYRGELDAFVSAVEEGRPMSPSFTDGIEALNLAVAAAESLRSGAAVTLR